MVNAGVGGLFPGLPERRAQSLPNLLPPIFLGLRLLLERLDAGPDGLRPSNATASFRTSRWPIFCPVFFAGLIRLFSRLAPPSPDPRSEGSSECSGKRPLDPAGRLRTTPVDIVVVTTSGSSVCRAKPS